MSKLEDWAKENQELVNDTGDTNEGDLIKGALHLLKIAEEWRDGCSADEFEGANRLVNYLTDYCEGSKSMILKLAASNTAHKLQLRHCMGY